MSTKVNELDPVSTALIVIDAQEGFVNEYSEKVLPALTSAIQRAKANGIDVYFTRFINRAGSQWERLIGWSELCDSPSIDLHSEILPLASPGEVFDKHSYTSLSPEIKERLEASGTKNLLLTGISTDSCVLATAFDAFEQGFIPIVLTDCCVSQAGNEIHEDALRIIGRNIGSRQLVDSTEVLALP